MVREQRIVFKTKSSSVFEFLEFALEGTPMIGDRYKIDEICHEVVSKDYKYIEGTNSSSHRYKVIIKLGLKPDPCDSVCRSTRTIYQTGSRNHYVEA